MIDEPRLLDGLRKLLIRTERDIRQRLADEPALEEVLKSRHRAAVEATRAAAAGYSSFLDDAITQAAVHWLLACVFVRFLEDNGLVDNVQIAGRGERLSEAQDRRSLFYRQNPRANDADYLTTVFASTADLPGMADLFHREHNPLWTLGPSGTQTMELLRFLQQRDEASGELLYDFRDEALGTRFLGDLYQNLSEAARKRYALCQTPDFVIQFILDRTLTPALDVFGLEDVRLIDPTCGSGHFLLAAFDRLFARWLQREPTGNSRVLAQRALSAIAGVDLNPFAVAIARFRLLIAALKTCRIARLKDAPDFHFELATGDSLLHGRLLGRERGIQRPLSHDPAECFYNSEDAESLKRILGRQYQIVVGNPPYINVYDPTLRETYRVRYGSCRGKYQLTVPFIERFFNLALRPDGEDVQNAGFVGLIVSNAFMKRSFGRRLVEDYIRIWDLTHVIDTSGVYLPAHGTPTAILLGRQQPPVLDMVRAVRGIRGEKSVPEDPAKAAVWSAIVDQVDEPGSESKWISVTDAPRVVFQTYPWSVGGGGAAELKELLEENVARRLSSIADVGVLGMTNADEIMIAPRHTFNSQGVPEAIRRAFAPGDSIGDWTCSPMLEILFPYTPELVDIGSLPALLKWLWPARTVLGNRATFSQGTYFSEGRPWWSWHQLTMSRLSPQLSIAFAFVETHNQFVLDRGGKVFIRSSPMVKLDVRATEEEHLGLLGILNSSTACFWMKQECFPKGGDTVGKDGARVRKTLWDVYYEFDITAISRFPLPRSRPSIAPFIQSEADSREAMLPSRLCAGKVPSASLLRDGCKCAAVHLSRMISFQEELDWQVYRLYGLLDEDVFLPPDQAPPLALGQRAFEICMARQILARDLDTTWFERHDSNPSTEIPAHWPEKYRRVVEKRLEIIQTNRDIALIEQPEYKRRWNVRSWGELEQEALRNWLLDRLGNAPLWREHEFKTCARLADRMRRDTEFMQVAELLTGRPDFDVTELVTNLAVHEAVPFLPPFRYKDSGLRKRAEWEQVWAFQRREDAGEKVEIPVPPKYRSGDFLEPQYWNLRGGLDVPKERFIVYPHLERDSDASPVIGWAGWNHLHQARALANYYHHVKEEEGWPVERLKPVLAGLLDLLPWLKQWHNELDPATGERMGDAFETFLDAECQELGFQKEELLDWRPPQQSKRRAKAARQ